MLVYNITTKVAHSVLEEWLQWQKEILIPEIMSSESFTAHHLYRLLEHDDDEGCTFVTQFIALSIESYENYRLRYAELIRKQSLEKWGHHIIAFHSLLQSVV